MDKKDYDPKFLLDYKIPGFYNFYKNLSNYINQNITLDYFNNEKKIRELFKGNIEQEKNNFHDKEEMLLNTLYEGFSKEFSFEFEIINKIPPYLILKDYINYYLDKNNSKDGMNCKLIQLLLELRFNNDNKKIIIVNNQNDDFKIVLIKIMWIESNVNYILQILNIYKYAKEIFNEENILYNLIEKEKNNITYITNENRNPEHTIEVNECYYIILASLCYSVTSDEIKLINDINLENNEKEINVNIDKYCSLLKEINNILESLNNDLYIYLNEMFIINELIIIIELIKLKNIDLDKIEHIRKLLRENALIIQKNQPDKISELISNFLNINDSLISKDINNEEDKNYCNKYYDTLKHIYFKEINKVIDINYRSKILEKIIFEKEIIKKSNDIFQILLKKLVKTEKGKFKQTIKDIKKGEQDEKIIIELLENNLADEQKDYYFALSETILYFFEKNSLIYLNNALYDKKDPVLLDGEPLDIFKDCIEYLDQYNFSYKKIKEKIKHITKLICLGYIKVFCYIFIKMLNDEANSRIKNPEKIIEIINKHNLKDMIKIYIYKIIYYQNQKQLSVFLNRNIKEKYNLEKYIGFKEFIKFT